MGPVDPQAAFDAPEVSPLFLSQTFCSPGNVPRSGRPRSPGLTSSFSFHQCVSPALQTLVGQQLLSYESLTASVKVLAAISRLFKSLIVLGTYESAHISSVEYRSQSVLLRFLTHVRPDGSLIPPRTLSLSDMKGWVHSRLSTSLSCF